MKFFVAFFVQIVLLISVALAQELPPLSTYYSPKDYLGGNQNWSITQDWDGYIYVANNRGVMVFDGIRWQTISVASKNRIIRSLYADKITKRIYVGLFEEFGYLTKTETGKYTYTSLSHSVQNYEMSNDEIWNIVNVKGKIYFQSFASFFVYDGKTCKNVPLKQMYLYFLDVEDELYAYVLKTGLSKYDEKSQTFTLVPGFCSGSRVIQIIPKQNQKIIITEDKGIFLLGNESCKRIDKLGDNYPIANRAIMTQNSTILIGSIDKGVLAFDTEGNLKWELNNNNGLKNNTVLNLFEDSSKNIWIALDKGLVFLHLNSSLRIMNSEKQNIGAVYGAAQYNGKLYLATNYGLFEQKENYINQKAPFAKTDNINGQVWDLKNIDNQLFICVNDHTHSFFGSKSFVFSPAEGGTSIKKARLQDRELLIQSTYSNICVYPKEEQGNWNNGRSVLGFVQPIKSIEVDYQENIWAAHFYKGLYKLRINKDLTAFTDVQYFPTINGINGVKVSVFKIDNRVVFSDETQLYIYNDIEKKIVPYKKLNDQLGSFKACKRIVTISKDKYWIVCNSEIILAHISNEKVNFIDVINTNSFNASLVDDADIVPLKGGQHLICLDNGYILYSEKDTIQHKGESKLQISSIAAYNQQGGQTLMSRIDNGEISYNYNTIIINLAYPSFGDNKDNFIIKYKLKNTSDWITQKLDKSIILAKLSPDEYQIEVQLFDTSGKQIDNFVYAFIVETAFLSNYAGKNILYYIDVLTLFYKCSICI